MTNFCVYSDSFTTLLVAMPTGSIRNHLNIIRIAYKNVSSEVKRIHK